MCTLKKMSEMTGLSEEMLVKKKPEASTAILKSLCMQCKRAQNETYAKIAKDFGLVSHSTVISNIQMIERNPNHPKIKEAKQAHKCYRQEVCDVPETITEAKTIETEDLEDLLDKTSVFDSRFEEILRQIRNKEIRNSPQRLSCRI